MKGEFELQSGMRAPANQTIEFTFSTEGAKKKHTHIHITHADQQTNVHTMKNMYMAQWQCCRKNCFIRYALQTLDVNSLNMHFN